MKHHHIKREFKKERTDRVDFRRRFYVTYGKYGTKIMIHIKPAYFDPYRFLLIVYYGKGVKLTVQEFRTFEKALDHALAYATDVVRWSYKGNDGMF